MRNKKTVLFLGIGIFLSLFSSCIVPWPWYQIDYEIPELPGWTDVDGPWSVNDENWLMEGSYDPNHKHRNRNADIMNKYIIDGALCIVGLAAKDEYHVLSKDPCRIVFEVYGFKDKHISFTVKDIDIRIKNGKNLSHLLDRDYQMKFVYTNESSTFNHMVWWDIEGTDAIFKLKGKPAIITATFEVEEIDKIVTKTITYELRPKIEWGLFLFAD